MSLIRTDHINPGNDPLSRRNFDSMVTSYRHQLVQICVVNQLKSSVIESETPIFTFFCGTSQQFTHTKLGHENRDSSFSMVFRRFLFLECSSVHTPWIAEEDGRLIQQWLTFGPRWKFMEKQWEARNANQLRNRWYHVVRPRLPGSGTDFTTLTRVLEQGFKLLPLPVLTKT
jgi:hypothetical protein